MAEPTIPRDRRLDYFAWRTLVQRCTNPNFCEYRRYGARGIRVCDRWKSYDNFVADMGPRPSRLHSIDRINNDGNYEPGNCRWATRAEQGRNRRNNRWIAFRGETRCATDWETHLGFPQGTLYQRIKWGWPLEEALTKPVGSRFGPRPGTKHKPKRQVP